MFGISWYRIKTVIIRTFYAERRNPTRIADTFYWPFLDIVIWGVVGSWVGQSGGSLQAQTILVLGLVFWEVILKTNLETTSTLLEELWSHSLLNLFASPITLTEWIIALMISGLMKGAITFLFSALLGLLFFNINVLLLGWSALLFFALSVLIGWSIGFVGAGCIIYAGHRLETVAWQIVWSFAPISTVFYPLSLLPTFVQTIAKLFPMAYLFESMRGQITTGQLPYTAVGISFLLALVYCSLSMLFFISMFEKSRQRGLGRLG